MAVIQKNAQSFFVVFRMETSSVSRKFQSIQVQTHHCQRSQCCCKLLWNCPLQLFVRPWFWWTSPIGVKKIEDVWLFEPKKNKKSSSLRFEHAIKAEALWSKVQSWYLCQASHLETQGFFRNKKRTCTTGSTTRCCWQALETPWKAPKDNTFDVTKKTMIFNVFRCVSYHFNIIFHPIELISKCESYTIFLHGYDWIVKIPSFQALQSQRRSTFSLSPGHGFPMKSWWNIRFPCQMRFHSLSKRRVGS